MACRELTIKVSGHDFDRTMQRHYLGPGLSDFAQPLEYSVEIRSKRQLLTSRVALCVKIEAIGF